MKVNGLLDKYGYSTLEENDAIPLKRFIHCGHRGRLMRGYLMRKKNIHYYKCNTVGCGNNKNANALNIVFGRILDLFNLDVAKEVIQEIKEQTVATFNQLTKDHQNTYQALQKQCKELNQKINRLEERYIEEEINGDLYNKYSEKFDFEKKEIEQNILKCPRQVSDLEKGIDLAVNFAQKLANRWHSADYVTKQGIQFYYSLMA